MDAYVLPIVLMGLVIALIINLSSFRQIKPEHRNKRFMILLFWPFMRGSFYTKKGELQIILSVVLAVAVMVGYTFYVWSKGN